MLQFNDTSAAKNGFCQEIDSICKSTALSYPLPSKARRLNSALDTYFLKTMMWCGNWSVGDMNNVSDLARATTALVSGRQAYGLDNRMLIVESVWITNSQGTYVEILPTENIINTSDSGFPTKYNKTETTMIFDKVPVDGGTIKVMFRRKLPTFSADDTIKTAGIPIGDFYLARLASLPWLIENGKDTAKSTATQIADDELTLSNFFAFRGRDENKKARRMVPMQENNR